MRLQRADLTASERATVARRRASRELIAFFALTFAITFGLGLAVIFFRPQFEAVFGPLGPLLVSWPYYVGVSAPTISAVVLSALFGGLEGVKNLFRGLVRPFQLRWLFVAILVSAPLTLLTTANIFVDPGPWGEETGWRGFALPRLLTRFSPLTAAIVLGVFWGWHAPGFLASGLTQSKYKFGWFLLAVICMSIFLTWIYVNANRNFLVAGFIPHAVNNLMGFSNAFIDAKIQALVMIAIVVLILVFSGGLWRAVSS
jgi:uncharacterized protein